jgi:hypothetical protein
LGFRERHDEYRHKYDRWLRKSHASIRIPMTRRSTFWSNTVLALNCMIVIRPRGFWMSMDVNSIEQMPFD